MGAWNSFGIHIYTRLQSCLHAATKGTAEIRLPQQQENSKNFG
jgi:hypothetical protein